MGGKQTKPAQPSAKAGYYPDVEVVQAKHIDPHYGEVRYVRDKKTNQLLVLKELYVNTKPGFDAESDFLNHRVDLKHPNVVEIIGFNSVDQTSFCASSYKISVFIEVQEKTLQAQLNDRIFNRQAYSEGELLHIAESLVSALSYFQNKGHGHGDIRPTNIFVKANTVKLSDPSLAAHRGASAITLVALYGQKSYLAPELLGSISKKAFDMKTDKHKADVFALGVTLLSLATLSNCEDLYNYKLGTLNESLLGERLAQVKARYNPMLYDLIRSMLTLDEKVRPDFVTLAKALNVYNVTPSLVQAPVTQTVQTVQTTSPQVITLDPIRLQPGDDLDARIRAALERSTITYNLASPQKNSNMNTDLNNANTTGQASNTVSNEYLTRNVAPALTNVVNNYTTTNYTSGEVIKRSYAPGTYTTSEEVRAQPEGTLTSSYVTRAYTPVTYTSGNYSAVPYTVSGSTEGLKKSYSNLGYAPTTYTTTTGGVYTTGANETGEVLKRSYAPATYPTGYATGTYTITSPTIRTASGETIVRSGLPPGYTYTTYSNGGYTTGPFSGNAEVANTNIATTTNETKPAETAVSGQVQAATNA